MEVGSYSDSDVTSPELFGIIIVAQNGYPFAAYDGYDNGNQVSNYMATWKINAGCTLTLLQTYILPAADDVFSMSASPDGKLWWSRMSTLRPVASTRSPSA